MMFHRHRWEDFIRGKPRVDAHKHPTRVVVTVVQVCSTCGDNREERVFPHRDEIIEAYAKIGRSNMPALG